MSTWFLDSELSTCFCFKPGMLSKVWFVKLVFVQKLFISKSIYLFSRVLMLTKCLQIIKMLYEQINNY